MSTHFYYFLFWSMHAQNSFLVYLYFPIPNPDKNETYRGTYYICLSAQFFYSLNSQCSGIWLKWSHRNKILPTKKFESQGKLPTISCRSWGLVKGKSWKICTSLAVLLLPHQKNAWHDISGYYPFSTPTTNELTIQIHTRFHILKIF